MIDTPDHPPREALDEGQLFALLGAPNEEDREADIGLAALRKRLFGITAAPISIGDFELRGVLGEGAMGKVYRAYSSTFDCERALKILHVDGEDVEGVRERLLIEARAMARVNHPNVVQVRSAGVSEGRDCFLEMDLVEGVTLRRWQRQQATGWRSIVARYVEAGRGLAAVHRAGLIHGDFKPDNVLVRSEQPVAMVSDFGLACGVYGERMADGSVRSYGGTLYYAAPELLLERRCDASSDQFSFCVALYEALCGALPYSRSFPELRSTHETEAEETSRVRHVLELQSGVRVGIGEITWTPRARAVPMWVRRAVARGLRREPDQRFPSMDVLVAALDLDRRRRRHTGVAATALVGLSAAAAVASHLHARALVEPCTRGSAMIGSVWSSEAREDLAQRFSEAPAIIQKLESYSRSWAQAHDATCKAGIIERSLTPAVQAVRESCLGARRSEFQELLRLLRSDRPLDVPVVAAISGLRSVERCGYRIDAIEPPPEGERARVAAVQDELARAYMHEVVQDFDEARVLADHAFEEAEAGGYLPVIAEARYQRGRIGLQDALRRAGSAALDDIPAAFVDLRDTVLGARHDIQLANDAVLFALRSQARLRTAQFPVCVDWLDGREAELRPAELLPEQRGQLALLRGIRVYGRGSFCTDGALDSPQIRGLREASGFAEEAAETFAALDDPINEAKARRNLGDALLRRAECGEHAVLAGALDAYAEARQLWSSVEEGRSRSLNIVSIDERMASALTQAGQAEEAAKLRDENFDVLMAPGLCAGESANALIERANDVTVSGADALIFSERALSCTLLPAKRIEALYLAVMIRLGSHTPAADAASVAALSSQADELVEDLVREDARARDAAVKCTTNDDAAVEYRGALLKSAYVLQGRSALLVGDRGRAEDALAAAEALPEPPDWKKEQLVQLRELLRAPIH